MATRQEMFTALNLSINSWRICTRTSSMEFSLQGKKLDGEPLVYFSEDGISSQPLTFEDLKIHTKNHKVAILQDCSNVDVIFKGVSKTFLENGFTDIEISQSDVLDDMVSAKNILESCLIDQVIIKNDLNFLADSFETFTPKISVKPKVSSQQRRWANITHDILDAISYELIGKNSYTGELHNLKIEELKKLVSSRLHVAQYYLVRLLDTENFQTLITYITGNYINASQQELETLGQYIDTELNKLIMVRRWWAL